MLVIKNLPVNAGHARDVGLIPGSGRFPESGKWQPSPIFLPGKFHGQRNLTGSQSIRSHTLGGTLVD